MTVHQALQEISSQTLRLPANLDTPSLSSFTNEDGKINEADAGNLEKYLSKMLKTVGVGGAVLKVFIDSGIELKFKVEKEVDNHPVPTQNHSNSLRPPRVDRSSTTTSSSQLFDRSTRLAGLSIKAAISILEQEVGILEVANLRSLDTFTTDGVTINGSQAEELEGYVRSLIGTLLVIRELEKVLEAEGIEKEKIKEWKRKGNGEWKGKGKAGK